jgi:hypothetical protein
MNWLAVRFLEAVTALHVKGMPIAVLDRKHVNSLASNKFTGPFKTVAKGFGVVSGITQARQNPDSNSLSKGSVPIDEIPAVLKPQI